MTTPVSVTGSPHPRVVLVGPPGSGKSSIGRRLANALNCELIDSDVLIEERESVACGEVFSSLGELAFHPIPGGLCQGSTSAGNRPRRSSHPVSFIPGS